MLDTPYIAEVAALIGDPARANMLLALKDDGVLSATELAHVAGVAPNTASGHLARLTEAGLVVTGVWYGSDSALQRPPTMVRLAPDSGRAAGRGRTAGSSQKRSFCTPTAFASPLSRCTIDTWSIKPANLAIKVIAAVLVLGVNSIVQGCARESTDLSQVGFRDRQADACPSLDEVRGILATNSGKVVVYIEPGHLAFYASMPSGCNILRVIQTPDFYDDHFRPLRYQRSIH